VSGHRDDGKSEVLKATVVNNSGSKRVAQATKWQVKYLTWEGGQLGDADSADNWRRSSQRLKTVAAIRQLVCTVHSM